MNKRRQARLEERVMEVAEPEHGMWSSRVPYTDPREYEYYTFRLLENRIADEIGAMLCTVDVAEPEAAPARANDSFEAFAPRKSAPEVKEASESTSATQGTRRRRRIVRPGETIKKDEKNEDVDE